MRNITIIISKMGFNSLIPTSYFADYLSVLETRKWLNTIEIEVFNEEQGSAQEYVYQCEPLLKPDVIQTLSEEGQAKLRADLGLAGIEFEDLWGLFLQDGIAIPFNLIVAGTVNMDETTHGFSRKVIDRALTIDFGEFFPNKFDDFFEPKSKPSPLSFPRISSATREDLASITVDSDGRQSVAFLSAVNTVLKGTPFELAYRALNELLLSVVSYAPEDSRGLEAVWDDFLMCKVLPRIDGDEEKLAATGAGSTAENVTLLSELEECISMQLEHIWGATRPELLLESIDSDVDLECSCRTKKKLNWMSDRLKKNGFCSFWP